MRRLKMQMSPYLLGGKVEESRFRIPKRPTGLFSSAKGISTAFCFCGEYRQTGRQTEITYQIRPYVTVVFSHLFLLFAFLSMLIAASTTKKDILITVLGCLFFLSIFLWVTQMEKKNCIADFEKRLTMEIPRYE